MKLWRISNYDDLLGIGGERAPGRWHNKGIPIVYLADSSALALLEVLVHFEMEPSEAPVSYQLLEVEMSDRVSVLQLDGDALHKGWQNQYDLTRAIGDEWLSAQASALLRVPSAVAPNSYNYLFNPRHTDASLAEVVSITKHPFDKRLFA